MGEYLDKKQPLWLPEGSIRAMIAIGTLSLTGILMILSYTIPDWLVLWNGIIISNYYDMRKNTPPKE